MRYRLTSWLFVTLAMTLALPVIAQVQVDGQASGFRYALGDLVPGDAVTPEIKLATSWEPGVSGGLRVFDWEGNIHDDDQADRGQGSMVLEQAWGHDLRSRTSYEVGGASPVLGWSIEITPHGQQSIGIDVTSEGPWMTFQLSPKTSITFELDVAMRLSMAPETDTEHWRGTSMAALMLSVQDPETVSFWDSDELRGWVGETDYGPYQLVDEKDGLLSVSYTNTSNDWVRGEIGHKAWGFALAFNDVPPVPEPSVWTMYTAGISLLGAAWQRRRRGRCSVG
jgi:hypothetical protein